VLLLSKGLVQPLGLQPYEYVKQRIRARAIASLGGPALAREAVAGIAALVLGSPDVDTRTQLGEVFDRAGLVCERTDDVIGVEIAGAAKNAAALAAAAAVPHGLNAAGIAAAQIWRECVDYGLAAGARVETFSGLAGVGDLTATVLAPASRNRQAGELLGNGVAADQIPARIGQTSEALDSVPLLAAAAKGAGIDAHGLEGLAELIGGRLSADDWVAGLRRAERERQAA
jgi:glycerol-3-phosphate dehydrogenase (NAD(P)+)